MKKPPAVKDDICFCPPSGILDVIAKKQALLIIAIAGNEGEKGFNEPKKRARVHRSEAALGLAEES